MRRVLLFSFLVLAFATRGWGQETYEILVEPSRGGGDSLLLDIYIKSNTAVFPLGNTNVVIDLPNNKLDPFGAVGFDQASWFWQPNLTYNPITVSGLVNRINVTISITADLSQEIAVPTDYELLARVYVPVLGCPAGTVDPQVSFAPTPTIVRSTAGIIQTFGGETTPPISLAPEPVVNGPVELSLVGATVTGNFNVGNLTAGSNYSWTVFPAGPPVTPAGLQGELAAIDFAVDGVYTITLIETNSVGCIGSTDFEIEVIRCNPGLISPDQEICQGEATVVFVDDTYAAQDSSRWEYNFNDTTPANFQSVESFGGSGRRGATYFTPPLPNVGTYYFRLAVFCGGNTYYSTNVAVDVQAPPTAGSITPASSSVCLNGSVLFAEAGGTGVVAWQQSLNGILWTPALGVPGPGSFLSDPLFNTTYFRAIYQNGCDTVPSNVALVTIDPLPAGNIITPSLDSLCAGGSTPPLEGNIISGDFGFWTTDGAGSFTVAANPLYVTDAADAGRTVTLSWIVTSGACPPDVNSLTLDVREDPAGSFAPLPVTDICAGGSVDSVRASVLVGTGGYWDDEGEGGTFLPNINSPVAQYVSNPASSGSIRLLWITQNEPCVPDTQSRTLNVLSTQIGGSFPPLANPEVCFGDSTEALGATVTFGSGRWLSTSSGGVFFPDPFNPNARFIPSSADGGTTVTLTWQITNGPCTPLNISQDVFVRGNPTAVIFIPTGTAVCVDDSISLSALASGGDGLWTIREQGTAVPGAGSFSPNATSTNARYLPGLADANKRFDLSWTVTSPVAACGVDQETITLQVSGPPSGSFSLPPATEICAGASTDPLGATLGNPLFTGVWRTPNGAGTFSDSLNPNGFYNSDLADADTKIALQWVVTSAGCGEIVFEDSVQVNNSTVEGTFAFQGLSQLVIRDSLCYVDTSLVLDVTVNGGASGVFRTPNGTGSFRDRITGVIDTLNTSGNVVYVPSAGDRGNVVEIQWVITSTDPLCGRRTLVKFLDIRDLIDGDFTPIPNVCYPFPSDTLRATKTGDPLAKGKWIAVGASGSSAFAPSDTARNVRFLPALADVGRTIEFQWVVSNDVCPSDTTRQNVFVGGEDLVTVGTSDPDSSICFGDTTTLFASGGDFYIWSPASEVDDPNLDTVQAFPIVNRTFQVRAFLGNCSFTKAIEIEVREGLPVDATAAETAICEGQSTLLGISGPVETGATAYYQWEVVGGDVNSLIPAFGGADPNQENPFIRPIFTTLYRVLTRTTNGCLSYSTPIEVTVTPNDPPVVSDVSFCEVYPASQDTIVVEPFASTCDTVYWYLGRRDSLAGLGFPASARVSTPQTSPSDSVLIDTITDAGIRYYTIQCVYRNPGLCITEKEVMVTMLPSPDTEFQARPSDASQPFKTSPTDPVRVPEYAPVVEFQDITTDPVQFYFWNFGDPLSGGANEDSASAVVHRYSRTGTYTVVLQTVNDLGCVDLEVKNDFVIVEPNQYYFPTAFTPNGDGINDIFRPLPNTEDNPTITDLSANADLLELIIFDRWGNIIYKAVDPDQENPNTLWQVGWSGRSKDGTPFETGSYTYTAKIKFPNRGIVSYRGVVVLLY